MRIRATSNGEQRVQVLISVVQGLSQKQRQLMHQYFELVDWQGFKLPSAERRQRDSLKSFERSVKVCKDWIRLEKELATLGEELPPAEKRKKQSPGPTKRDASKEEFARRALAEGNMCHLPQEAGDGLESIVEFQVQIKGHSKREYEDKWQGWQNWTDEKVATKLTKDDQQLVLLLPPR